MRLGDSGFQLKYFRCQSLRIGSLSDQSKQFNQISHISLSDLLCFIILIEVITCFRQIKSALKKLQCIFRTDPIICSDIKRKEITITLLKSICGIRNQFIDAFQSIDFLDCSFDRLCAQLIDGHGIHATRIEIACLLLIGPLLISSFCSVF